MSAPIPNYAHKATLVEIHDGDTFTLRVDFGQLTHGIKFDPAFTIRLAGIDCWEISGSVHPLDKDRAKGREAYRFSLDKLTNNDITIQTVKPDLKNLGLEKYGRVLAHVWVGDDLLADLLRANGSEKRLVL